MTQIDIRFTIRKKDGSEVDDMSKAQLTHTMKLIEEHIQDFHCLDVKSVPDELHLTIAEARIV